MFKEAFNLYKELRLHAKNLISETIRNRQLHNDKEDDEIKNTILGLNNYLAPFSDEGRQINLKFKELKLLTLEYVCFHKNWRDISNFTDCDNY